MCRVAKYKSRSCGCKWLRIIEPCAPNAGFSQCYGFGNGSLNNPLEEYEDENCPRHVLCGWYDRNYTRMIERERNGIRIGTGPYRYDTGVDLRCIMM